LEGLKDLRGLIHFSPKLTHMFESMRVNLELKGGSKKYPIYPNKQAPCFFRLILMEDFMLMFSK